MPRPAALRRLGVGVIPGLLLCPKLIRKGRGKNGSRILGRMIGADGRYAHYALRTDRQRNSRKLPEQKATAFRTIAFFPMYMHVFAPIPYLDFELFN